MPLQDMECYRGLWGATVECGVLQWNVGCYSGLWGATVGYGVLPWVMGCCSGRWAFREGLQIAGGKELDLSDHDLM